MGELIKGTVKWFDGKKGYGFIVGDDDSEIFVHFSGIQGDGYKILKEGQKVEYLVGQGAKGPQAENVAVI